MVVIVLFCFHLHRSRHDCENVKLYCEKAVNGRMWQQLAFEMRVSF